MNKKDITFIHNEEKKRLLRLIKMDKEWIKKGEKLIKDGQKIIKDSEMCIRQYQKELKVVNSKLNKIKVI